jgi:hypothetical protein
MVYGIKLDESRRPVEESLRIERTSAVLNFRQRALCSIGVSEADAESQDPRRSGELHLALATYGNGRSVQPGL